MQLAALLHVEKAQDDLKRRISHNTRTTAERIIVKIASLIQVDYKVMVSEGVTM